MSKRSLALVVALSLAAYAYAPDAAAVKVTRDPGPPPVATPPAAAKAAAVAAPSLPKLTAAQIVDKNTAARGGLVAWRAVKAMRITGQLDAGGKKDTKLPYTLEVKRPNKERMTLEFAGQTAIQVYDGQKGWKVRPYLNRNDVEPFSKEELQKAASQPQLDGLLIDSAVKGNKVEVEGTDMVEGKGAYRLKVTSKDGHTQRVWVDGSTFLEAKVQGSPRHFDGRMRDVETYLHDYRTIDGGLKMAFVAETHVDGERSVHSMTIENVKVNPQLDESVFGKPQTLAAATPARKFTMLTPAVAPKSH